ncbi:MAG: hypothetical protein AAGI51_05890, partial [Pseudomonadota bacterium]
MERDPAASFPKRLHCRRSFTRPVSHASAQAACDRRQEGVWMFEPDGWVYRARIGLLVPDGDVGPESEVSAMVPAGVGVNASRFRFPSGQGAEAPGQIGIAPVEAVAAPGPLDDA